MEFVIDMLEHEIKNRTHYLGVNEHSERILISLWDQIQQLQISVKILKETEVL